MQCEGSSAQKTRKRLFETDDLLWYKLALQEKKILQCPLVVSDGDIVNFVISCCAMLLLSMAAL